MVKKKGSSKRVSLKDKYKIERRVVETHRKRKKQAKKDKANGKVVQKRRDPGIPNSWPFKQDLLKQIQKARQQQQQLKEERKEVRKGQLRELKQHQAEGGTARTIQELLEQANQKQKEYNEEQDSNNTSSAAATTSFKSDNTQAAGQQSRRAYLRELKSVVETADVLLQVLDARDPMGSRISPQAEASILSKADKKMVLVLNKIDLVPKQTVSEWLTVLRRSHPTVAIKASNHANYEHKGNQNDADSMSNTPIGMEGLLQLLKNYARTSTNTKTTIVAGIIGYPNTGKSSIINALKRTRVVGVSPTPGFTTCLQEVLLDKHVRLLDSPGVVFDDRRGLLGNCVHAASTDDPVPAVDALLQQCQPESLMVAYQIPRFATTDGFLASVAKAYGRVRKGGRPDKIGAARQVLRDWNCGKIKYYTPAPKIEKAEEHRNDDAVVLSKFGVEFDVSKHDLQVLGALNDDLDEMDFVAIEGNHVQEGESESDGGTNFFDNVDDDDDNDAEMALDNDDTNATQTKHASRREAEDAEDYDFDAME